MKKIKGFHVVCALVILVLLGFIYINWQAHAGVGALGVGTSVGTAGSMGPLFNGQR